MAVRCNEGEHPCSTVRATRGRVGACSAPLARALALLLAIAAWAGPLGSPSATIPPRPLYAQDEPATATLHLPWVARGAARAARLETRALWGGPARALLRDGDRVWLGSGGRLALYDGTSMESSDPELAGPTAPTLVVALPMPGQVRGVVLDPARQILHVALLVERWEPGWPASDLEAPGDRRGLLVSLDVSEAAAPRELLRQPIAPPSTLALEGDRLVVGVGRDRRFDAPDDAWVGLEIFALQADGLPGPRARHVLSDAHALALSGGYAYACDPTAGVLAVIDLRVASAPRDAGLVRDAACLLLATRRPEGEPAYLIALEEQRGGAQPVLVTYDLAEPSRPAARGRLDMLDPAWDGLDAGDALDVVFVTALAVDEAAGAAWVAGRAGPLNLRPWLRRIDLRDPSDPRPVWQARDPGLALALDARDDQLLAAEVDGGDEGLLWPAVGNTRPLSAAVAPAAGGLARYVPQAAGPADSTPSSSAIGPTLPDPQAAPGISARSAGPGDPTDTARSGDASRSAASRSNASPSTWRRATVLRLPSAWIVETAHDAVAERAYLLEEWPGALGEAVALRLWALDTTSDPPRLIGRLDLDPRLVSAFDALAEQDRWRRDMVALDGHVVLTVGGETFVIDAREVARGGPAALTRVATGATALATDGATLFTAGGGALVAWSIGEGAQLLPLGPPLEIPDHPWLRLAAAPGRLWLTSAPDAITLVDTEDSGALRVLAERELPVTGAILAASDSRVVALDGTMLTLLEATTEGTMDADRRDTTIVERARHALAAPVAPAAALAFDGRRAWWPGLEGGLIGLDLAAPRAPAELVRAAPPAWAPPPAPPDEPGGGGMGEEGPARGPNPWQASRVTAIGPGRVLLARFGGGAAVYGLREAVAP